MCEKLQNKIIDYIYIISKQPVLYRDLLSANCLYNEKMYVDPGKLNFRLKIEKAYLAYGLICAAILVPLFLITHGLFANLDSHVSIVGAVAATSGVFIGFSVFRAKMRDIITKRLIQKAWKVHFPHFPYEKYSEKVEIIYNEAVKKEIQKKDLEQYVLDRLVGVNDQM